MTLSNGSIIYADSLTDGVIGTNDSVLLLQGEGTPCIDASPHIKVELSNPTPYLPHKCSGRVAILFTREVFDHKKLEWRGTHTYRYLMYGFYQASNGLFTPGAPPNWTGGFDYYSRDFSSYGRFPSDDPGRYYAEVYANDNVYRHCYFGDVGFAQYAEDNEWALYDRYFNVQGSDGIGAIPGIVIEFAIDVTLGGTAPPLPEIGWRLLNLAPEYTQREDNQPCTNSNQYTGGASWGLLEDRTVPGDAYQEEVDIYRSQFFLGGVFEQVIPLPTPIPVIEDSRNFQALVSVTKNEIYVKILYGLEAGGFEYLWLYTVDKDGNVSATYFNAPEPIIAPTNDWQVLLYANYGPVLPPPPEQPCLYQYSSYGGSSNTYNFKRGYKSIMYVEDWTDLWFVNNSSIKSSDMIVKLIQQRADVLIDSGSGES